MPIGADSETWLIEPGLLAPRLVCVSYCQENQAPVLVHRNHARDCVHWLLGEEIVGANIVYDLAVWAAEWPELLPIIFEALMEGRIHDVLTRQKLIDIALGCYRSVYRKGLNGKLRQLNYNLNDLWFRFARQDLDKDTWRLRYAELEPYPIHLWPVAAQQYALMDAYSPQYVFYAQAQECSLNLWDEPAQMRADWALQLTSCWGFNTDLAQVDKLIRQINVEQYERKRRLIGVGLVRLDGSRAKKLAQARMLKLAGTDFSDFQLTDTGKRLVKKKEMTRVEAIQAGYFSLNEEACEATNDELLIEYAQYGQFQNLLSKVRALNVSVPVQTGFEIMLETGRTSSFGSKVEGTKETRPGSVALQNPPRAEGFRECFIAGKGMGIISCDYGMAELVSLGEVCYQWFGFSALRDALNRGFDPHLDFGAQQMGITYEEALANKDHPEVDAFRQRSKPANFGYPGGLGVRRFRDYARGYGVELTEEQSKQLKEAWLQKWPEMPYYFKRIRDILHSNGEWIEREDDEPILKGTIEQLVSRRLRGKCSFTEACNSMFQGLTADAAKAALFEVSRLCYTVPESPLYGCRIVNFIHDEILLEAPLFKAHEAAKELEKVMAAVYQRFTPATKITAEAALMLRWRKKAKPYYVNGRLRPWEESPKFQELLAEGKIAA